MIDSQRLLVHLCACGIFISATVRILHRKTEIFVRGGTVFTGVQIFRDIAHTCCATRDDISVSASIDFHIVGKKKQADDYMHVLTTLNVQLLMDN